jgi:tripartite-type tricarboxylate transporter receptor subunit TctC
MVSPVHGIMPQSGGKSTYTSCSDCPGQISPAGLPKDVADRMSHLSKQALEHPDLVRSFREQGATAWFTTMAEISAFRAAQQAKLAPVIRASGARVD